MDKQGKIAVALAMMVIFGVMYYDSQHQPPLQPPVKPSPSATPATAGATAQSVTASAPVVAGRPAVLSTPEPEVPEATLTGTSPSVEFTFTNHGGGISRALLVNHARDQDNNGKKVLLNEYGPVPIGAISELPGEGANAPYAAAPDGQGAGITYQRTTAQQIQITKKFTLPAAPSSKDDPNQYVATLDLSFTNQGAQPYKSDGYYVYLGSAAPIHEKDQARYICMDWYLNGKTVPVNVMSAFNASKIPIIGYELHPEKTEYTATGDNIVWAGVYSQYFTTIVTPAGGGANRVWARRIPLDILQHQSGADWLRSNPPGAVAPWYAIDGALGMQGFELAPGAVHTQQFKIYLGPRQYQVLKHLGEAQSEILHLGWFGFVSKFLLNMMNMLHGRTGVSYAVAIIVLTLVIKLLLWPLQNRATQSMKKMQALTPKMNELREKYKDDPAKLNQETIKLYKTYGVNPLAGCLPAFIQMPIFIGFYTMLGSAIELRNSRFFWVHDLSQPDKWMTLPGLGFSINLLPLCMAATSVWMMAITPKSGDKSQQNMMMFMPLIFLVICYNYASGLALYMMVSNLFSVAQLYLTRNQAAPTLEKIAAAASKKSARKR